MPRLSALAKYLYSVTPEPAQPEVNPELLERYGASHGLPTLDARQLAVARRLHPPGAADGLVAAGKVLCRVAALEGMNVIDPESGTL
jgi:hypothetical protein